MGKTTKKLSSLFRGGVIGGLLLSSPLCYNAKTLSFRVEDSGMIKTVNSVFLDHNHNREESQTPESWFTNSSETASHSTTESDQDLDAESLEMVVRGVVRSSERLFFDPGGATSSIASEKSKACILTTPPPPPPIEEISVSVAMESDDPYVDFRRSMEEMVRSHGELAEDWKSLESMLAWYLRMNESRSHDVIVRAFVDLVSGLYDDSGAGTSDSARYSTAVFSLQSSPLCSLSSKGQTETEEEERRSR